MDGLNTAFLACRISSTLGFFSPCKDSSVPPGLARSPTPRTTPSLAAPSSLRIPLNSRFLPSQTWGPPDSLASHQQPPAGPPTASRSLRGESGNDAEQASCSCLGQRGQAGRWGPQLVTEELRWVQWWILKSVAGLEQCIQRGEEVEGETRLRDGGGEVALNRGERSGVRGPGWSSGWKGRRGRGADTSPPSVHPGPNSPGTRPSWQCDKASSLYRSQRMAVGRGVVAKLLQVVGGRQQVDVREAVGEGAAGTTCPFAQVGRAHLSVGWGPSLAGAWDDYGLSDLHGWQLAQCEQRSRTVP